MFLTMREYTVSIVCRFCDTPCRIMYSRVAMGSDGLLKAALNKRCPYTGDLGDRSMDRLATYCTSEGHICGANVPISADEEGTLKKYVCNGCIDRCELDAYVDDPDRAPPTNCLRRAPMGTVKWIELE